jgi:hypothetical protein
MTRGISVKKVWAQLLTTVKKPNNWHMALIIVVVGCAVFFTGLNNPFQGDDQTQIVNNPVVHSFSHVTTLFDGGTIYNGGSASTPLSGGYYRPLMMAFFSLIYSIFGAHPLYFHVLQILLVIASAILLYLVLQHLFQNPMLSLVLALIFLVHPINSQVAFAIPSLQDALCFFFGITAFWLLLRNDSDSSLWLVAGSLFLSLLSKEAGLLFVIMILLYIYLFNSVRTVQFIKSVAAPVIIWFLLRSNAVGVIGSGSNNAPIYTLSLYGRLMTMPSIMLFYLTKFVFPWKLATQYHWVYPNFSVQHVLFPLLIDLAAIGLVVATGVFVKRRATETQYYTFLFFAIWAGLGLVTYLQLFPTDMTASETWFYFSMAGLMGLIGTTLLVFKPRVSPIVLTVVAVLLIGTLGVRTAFRGTDYSSAYKLELKDVAASKEDFMAYTGLAQSSLEQGKYTQAKSYVDSSLAIYPDLTNYEDLGAIDVYQGKYAGAYQAYKKGLTFGSYSQILDDIGELTLVYGKPADNQKFFATYLRQYPHDPYLWTYYALYFYRYGNVPYAKASIQYALHSGGQVPQLTSTVYKGISQNVPLAVVVGNKTVLVP